MSIKTPLIKLYFIWKKKRGAHTICLVVRYWQPLCTDWNDSSSLTVSICL